MNAAPLQNCLLALYRTSGTKARQNANGWTSRCPAHDDANPSLSISQGDDGRVLLKCFAGCPTKAICAAVGLTEADLFDLSTPSTSTQISKSHENSDYRRRENGKPKGKSFATWKLALADLELSHGPVSKTWTYHDATGEPVGIVARWDRPGRKKAIRPICRHDDDWRIGAMPELRPLYGLPLIGSAQRVYIVEGEKCADAARSIGLITTTSSGGANMADKTDWSPLANRQCILIPDNDDAGEKYVRDVADKLTALSPPAVVKIMRLSNLADKEDIADWIDDHDSAEPDDLRRQVDDLAEAAEPFRADSPRPAIDRYEPFPTDALPESVRVFVGAGAEAIGCDPAFIVLPALTVFAAAIGASRTLMAKREWYVPSILWTALIGESGTSKTPAFQLVMKAINARQKKAFERFAIEFEEFQAQLAMHEKQFLEWKRDRKSNDKPPEKPIPPREIRFIVSDTTVEALAPILLENERGLLLARDELSGWLGSFDRYSKSGKAGADASQYLSMYNGQALIVDRRTGIPRRIYVPHAYVSICGGIQPRILNRALGSEHRESGMAARFLMAFPPRKAKQWTEADIEPALEEMFGLIVERLYELEPTVGVDGEPRPVIIGCDPGAKAALVDFYNAHNSEQIELLGELAAAWSKLEESAMRLALIIHCVRGAANDATVSDPKTVDVASMKAGIRLAEWFKHEAKRVYAMLSESDDDHTDRQLAEWIERKGGRVTAREVQAGHRRLKTADEAEAALNRLVNKGYGHWEPTPRGQRGQPTRYFVLSSVYGNGATAEENQNTVDVDNVC